jgi:hypothetical protein
MEMAFWFGLALAIPIGVATNLLTPAIQKWLETRSERLATRRRAEEEALKNVARQMQADHTTYWSFLFIAIVRLLTYSIFLGALSVVPFVVTSTLLDVFEEVYYYVTAAFNIITGSLALGVFIAFLNTARRTTAVARAVLKGNEGGRDGEGDS